MINRTRITQPAAPCGRVVFLAFARTGLNFPITPMVASCLMMRRAISAGLLALVSCHRAPAPLPALFTDVAGAWHRPYVRDPPPSAAPDPVPPAAIERIRAASYEGPGKLDARVYQLTSSAVALDVVQRWKPVPGTVFFCSGRFFVLVQWQTADRKALQEFVATLEKQFSARQ